MPNDNQYISLRNKYLPATLKVVFVLESPPAGHGYFYDEAGKPSEVLFRSFMSCLFGYRPVTKREGLEKLSKGGYLLVNPIYEPVNKLPDHVANRLILANYNNFIQDLLELGADKARLILVKKNICQLLETPLLADGFNVLNQGVTVPFPLHYHLNSFTSEVQRMLAEAGPWL